MDTTSQHLNDDATTPALIGEASDRSFVQAVPRVTRWLALGAIVGPVLFTLSWIVLGFLSPGYTAWGIHIAPYSPISQSISGLGLGITAPFMNTAFVFGGILILVGVIGIYQCIREIGDIARWSSAALLALLPLGMAVDGVFTLELGFLHFLGFGLALVSPVLGFVVSGLILRRVKRLRRFGTWLLLGSPLTLALVVLYFLTFSPTVAGTQTGVAGLTERLLVSEVFAWYIALGWLAFRWGSQPGNI